MTGGGRGVGGGDEVCVLIIFLVWCGNGDDLGGDLFERRNDGLIVMVRRVR